MSETIFWLSKRALKCITTVLCMIALRQQEQILIDKNGDQVIENYQRFLPDITDSTTWFAILYIVLGISLILSVDYYGRKRKIK